MRTVGLVIGVFFCVAAQVLAQGLGLPLAGTAERAGQGQFGISAGIVSGDDVDLYGVRLLYAPLEGWSLFLDGGVFEPDYGDSDAIVQIGTEHSISTDLPVDLAFRAAAYMPIIDEYDYIFGLQGGLVVSKQIESVERLSVYGSLGVLHERWKYDVEATYYETTYYIGPGGIPYGTTYSSNAYTVEDDRTEAALILGCLYHLSDQLSLYLEYANIDDSFFGAGIRCDL